MFCVARPRGRTVVLIAAACIIVLIVAKLWGRQQPPQNVLLITLDTTRADRLGSYGYHAGETSVFDQYAQQGVLFENAFAPAPITLPSHASMLTGLYPPEHGLRLNGMGRLPAQVPILSEILKKSGFQTAAFVAAAVLDSAFGLDRGFDLYDDFASQKKSKRFQKHRRPGQNVVDNALSWLDKNRSRRFFCWIHLFDAHAPYEARADVFGERFKTNPYDAGVATELQQVDRIVAFLREKHLDEKTLVVITADHGEGLGDHRESEHGMFAYNSTLRVPLVFAGTGFCQPARRISTTVSLTDITPTILDLCNLRAPDHLSGRSLKTALTGGELTERPCYAEAESPYALNQLCPLYVVISERWKYIDTTKPELYDVHADPGEKDNLAATHADLMTEMQNMLELLQQSFVVVEPRKLQLSDKQISDLSALGYAGGPNSGRSSDRSKSKELKDVKDVLPILEKYDEAKQLSLAGNIDAGIALLREVERIMGPGEFVEAAFLLGDCLALTDRTDEAVEVFLSVLEKHPEIQSTRFRLSAALAKQGKFDAAADEIRKILNDQPDSALAHYELGNALKNLRRVKEAITEYREAVLLAPNFAKANYELGMLLLQAKRLKEAAACFEESLRFESDNVRAQFELLRILVQLKEFDKAYDVAKKAVELDPTSFEAHFNFGVYLISQNRHQQGIAELREAKKIRPNDPNVTEHLQRAEAALNRLGK